VRVLIVQSKSILVAGLISLLQQDGRFEVISSVYKNKQHLNAVIDQFHPEAVIIDSCLGKSKVGILLSFLESLPQIRIIVVSLGDSQVEIYEKQNQAVNYIDDLIRVVQGETIVQRD